MSYVVNNEKVQTRALEYSAAYHCNLRCAGCSHVSPFSSRRTPDAEELRRELASLGRFVHAHELRLVGGEPLLNPAIAELAQVARESGICDIVSVTTNGLLLHRMPEELLRHLDALTVTLYPGFPLKDSVIRDIKDKAEANNTSLTLFSNPTFRTTYVSRPHPRDSTTELIYTTCLNAHLYHCHMIHEGSLYKCPLPPFLLDYIKTGDGGSYSPRKDGYRHDSETASLDGLLAYLNRSQSLDACCYCLGYLGKKQYHRQLTREETRHGERSPIERETALDEAILRKVQKASETMKGEELARFVEQCHMCFSSVLKKSAK